MDASLHSFTAATADEPFRRVVEWAPTAIVMIDRHGKIVLINVQTETLFGYQREELLGKSVETLVPARFARDHAAYRAGYFAAPQSRPMGSGRDLYARRRDGSEFPVEIGLTPIDSGDGVLVLAAIVDLTERKRLEERFRRVVEYAPNAMVMIDRDGLVVLANAQTEKLFGYPRAELIGQSVDRLVPEAARGKHVGYRAGFFANPQARPMGVGPNLYAQRADGSTFPVEIGLNPIETEDGVMVLASVVDLTERVRAQQKLENALREKTVLLNEVHHRVKNNLQLISSLLNLQAQHAGDPNARAILSESQARVRAMALTHQLLYERKDYSRVDLAEYLERLVQLLLSSYRDSGHVALRHSMPGGPLYLDLDRAVSCGLVVNELVTNAFKHAFPDGRRGEISIGLLPAGEALELVVADDGVGLPQGFDPAAVKSLGLQLVALLADQLGAAFSFESRGGSRFVLRFAGHPAEPDAT